MPAPFSHSLSSSCPEPLAAGMSQDRSLSGFPTSQGTAAAVAYVSCRFTQKKEGLPCLTHLCECERGLPMGMVMTTRGTCLCGGERMVRCCFSDAERGRRKPWSSLSTSTRPSPPPPPLPVPVPVHLCSSCSVEYNDAPGLGQQRILKLIKSEKGVGHWGVGVGLLL